MVCLFHLLALALLMKAPWLKYNAKFYRANNTPYHPYRWVEFDVSLFKYTIVHKKEIFYTVNTPPVVPSEPRGGIPPWYLHRGIGYWGMWYALIQAECAHILITEDYPIWWICARYTSMGRSRSLARLRWTQMGWAVDYIPLFYSSYIYIGTSLWGWGDRAQ